MPVRRLVRQGLGRMQSLVVSRRSRRISPPYQTIPSARFESVGKVHLGRSGCIVRLVADDLEELVVEIGMVLL